jgi:hypothetical protein
MEFDPASEAARWYRSRKEPHGAVCLNDNRRLILTDNTGIWIADRISKSVKRRKSVAPHRLGWKLGLSRDNRRTNNAHSGEPAQRFDGPCCPPESGCIEHDEIL